MRDTHFGMNGAARPHDISWSYDQSWKTDPRFRDEAEPQPSAKEPQGPLVIWYGDAEPEPPPYLIERLLPQTQTAILAGQFSAGKTFIAINIALAVMLGLEFAGHAVKRKGAVLWFAAEGASEVEIRLKAAALHATGEDQRGKLPFCRQAFSVPMLTQDGAQDRLMRIVEAAQADLSARFPEIELALIVVDTLNSAAGFADANDAAQAQKVMDLCRRVSDKSGALVLLVDHFGKLVETGIKGSMNKSDSADAILSALADKAQDGTISNRRMSVFKLRNGPSGETIPFALVSVPVNEWGSTSCGVDWQLQSLSERAAAQAQPPKPDWTGTGRLFRAAMVHALLDHGKEQRPFGFDTKALKAVEVQRVRAEFTARYPGETPDAKRKAFKRELASATAKNLIASREISGVDWLWFLKDADEHAKPDGRTDTDTPF